MVGILDSGMGAYFTLAEFRKYNNHSDVLLLADRENAPYGTKDTESLKEILTSAKRRLESLGAEKILLACCTASSVYPLLDEECRRMMIPIIAPVANEAVGLSKNKKIAVLSTKATKDSRAFNKAISSLDESAEVFGFSSPELVAMAEADLCDENLSLSDYEKIKEIVMPIKKSGIDTLILGCTHFGAFRGTIEQMLSVKTVDSAKIGALTLLKEKLPSESGATVIL